MNIFWKLSVLFAGSFCGAMVSTPILDIIIQFIAGSPYASTYPTQSSFTSTFYSSIIILLLAIMPIILAFTYFYVKGASEEQARENARTTAKEEISTLRYQLNSQQSDLAWNMAPFILPVVKRQTEDYLQERGDSGSNSDIPIQNPTTIAAMTIDNWVDNLAYNDEITDDEKEKLKEAILNNPPDLKED